MSRTADTPGADALPAGRSRPVGLLEPPSPGLRSIASALLEGRTDYAEKNLRLLAADPTVDPAWRSIIEGRWLLTLGRAGEAGLRFTHAAALAFCDAYALPAASDTSPEDLAEHLTGRVSAAACTGDSDRRHLRVAAYALNFMGDSCRRGDRPGDAVRHHLRACALWAAAGSRIEQALAASGVALDHDILDEPEPAIRWHAAAAAFASIDGGAWDVTPLAWIAPPQAGATAPPTVAALVRARQRDTLARFERYDAALTLAQTLIHHISDLRPGSVDVLRCRLRRCDILRRQAEHLAGDRPDAPGNREPAGVTEILARCRAELLELIEEFGAFGALTQREQIEADEQLEFVERLMGVCELAEPSDAPPSHRASAP